MIRLEDEQDGPFRVVIVVVAVTLHQGDGSTVHRAKDHRECRSSTKEYGGTRPHARPIQ
jgi:hypothetical protein